MRPSRQPLQAEAADLLRYQSIVVLTEGATRTGAAKTAVGLVRYRPNHVAAIFDRELAGLTADQVLGAGGSIPVIGGLGACPEADAIFIGIAPAGGKLPQTWKPILLDALASGIDIVSGLHDFLIHDAPLREAAEKSGARLIDVRRNNESAVAACAEFPTSNLRIHTVGQDCGVGKMVVALEIERELRRQGRDARFIATGQTGIMIAGEGAPVDCVVADFASGAVEKLVVRRQESDTLLIEGQGSLTHPSFSGVTTSLLHGCAPQGMVLCYEAGRQCVKELEHVKLKPLGLLIKLYEAVASTRCPSKVIAVAINGKRLSDSELRSEVERVEKEHALPACDVYRHGAGKLVNAVEELRTSNAQ